MNLLLVVAAATLPAWSTALDTPELTVKYRDRLELGGREVEAGILIETAPEQVFAVLDDVERYTEFMPYLQKLEVLERNAEGRIQYELVDPPVVSKRDYVLNVKVTKSPAEGRYQVSWEPAPEAKKPPSEGIVRVTLNQGVFDIAPDEKGTRLTYRLLTHPGGKVPDWIAKRSNTSSVPDLLKAIRKRCLKLAK